MGRRDRERIKRVLRGEEMGYREQQEVRELEGKLDALEQISERFGGPAVAEELRRLGQEGRLRV